MNPLAGKPLRYLIGAEDDIRGSDDAVYVVPYDSAPAEYGISIGYCNLFDEHNTGKYAPYLHDSDTAKEYNEGQIDPRGAGWNRNLVEQFKRRKELGFEYIELDNPDAYAIKDVIGAIELADKYGLKVIAKNPRLMEDRAMEYVGHSNVYGAIVERDNDVDPWWMSCLRREVEKADLPVWFVAFGSGRSWANSIAKTAKNYRNMGVTYSQHGEYTDSIDILKPA